MTKISPEAQSVLEVARSDYRLGAGHRQRLRERILERAATERPRTPGVSRGRTLWLVAGGAIVLSAFVATMAARGPAPVTVHNPPPAEEPASPLPIVAPNTESTAPIARETSSETAARNTAAPAGNAASAKAKTVSLDRLPDAKPAKPAASAQPVETIAKAPEPAPQATPASMPDEMRILREAHSALKNGELAVARARVNEHASTFPRGVFREERLTLSALVYCAEGLRDDARREAEALSREHPHSSHVERLRGSCAAE